MMLTPTELERMTIFVVAEMARRRKARGLRLNHPEAHAYIADTLLEGAREGRSVADLAGWGATLLSSDDVMPGVGALMPIVQVEGLFPDGAKLITVHQPIRPHADGAQPGEVMTPDSDIALNAGRRRVELAVAQHGRPAGPGGEPPSLLRGQCRTRISIARRHSACASTSRPERPFASNPARAEPSRWWPMAATAWSRGSTALSKDPWMMRTSARGPWSGPVVAASGGRDMATMSRARYAGTYGPTTGDRVRLGDTSLLAAVTRDHLVAGDELTTGAGQELPRRHGNGLRRPSRRRSPRSRHSQRRWSSIP